MLKVVVLQRLQSTFTLQCLLYRLLLFLLAAATQKKCILDLNIHWVLPSL